MLRLARRLAPLAPRGVRLRAAWLGHNLLWGRRGRRGRALGTRRITRRLSMCVHMVHGIPASWDKNVIGCDCARNVRVQAVEHAGSTSPNRRDTGRSWGCSVFRVSGALFIYDVLLCDVRAR